MALPNGAALLMAEGYYDAVRRVYYNSKYGAVAAALRMPALTLLGQYAAVRRQRTAAVPLKTASGM